MLNLLEKARRWLNPKAEPETVEEREEQVAFRAEARRIWLAYHDNEPWARAKMEAGLQLTPEALVYMERELTARTLAEEARQRNLKAQDPSDVEAISTSRSEPHSDGGSSGADSEGGV